MNLCWLQATTAALSLLGIVQSSSGTGASGFRYMWKVAEGYFVKTPASPAQGIQQTQQEKQLEHQICSSKVSCSHELVFDSYLEGHGLEVLSSRLTYGLSAYDLGR